MTNMDKLINMALAHPTNRSDEIATSLEDCPIRKSSYTTNGNLALALVDEYGCRDAMLTVNLPDYDLEDNEAFLDVNNCPFAEDIVAEYELGQPLGVYGQSGYCEYPLYSFDGTKLSALLSL